MGAKKTAASIYFNETHEQVRHAVRSFVNQEINPHLDDWEQTTVPLHDLLKKMGDLGFLGIHYDPVYGGQGLDPWADLVFLEETGHIKAGGVRAAIGVHTHCATPAIHMFGSEYLKNTYLKPAIAGEMVSAIAVTEPGTGSDVAALTTTAKRDGDDYVINGTKTFITNGAQADFITTLARTGEEEGYHCFGLFVVPTDTPGFSVGQKLDKLGWRSSDTALLYFDNVRIPKDNLIGEEGEGFIYQMQQFQHERFTMLPHTYVSCRDMIDMTVDYIKKRRVFGKPLIANQVLRHNLVDWLTEIESLKSLSYHIVSMKEHGLDVTREVSMGKLISGQLVDKVARGCLQMFGGTGFMSETYVSRFYRDAALIGIGGGANEIMREIIGKLERFQK